MKNILHSHSNRLFNLPSKFYRLKLALLGFGVFFFVSNLAHAQLPIFDDFESGLGNWNDGGNDCTLSNNTIINGNFNVRLRDNSGVASSTFSDAIDLSGYSSVTIDFLFITENFSNGEDFFVEYNDGGGYVTIGNYVRGTDFNNNTAYTISITLNSPTYNLSTNATFRIRADASGNSDRLYVDDINITGVSSGPCSEPSNQPTSLTFNNISDTTLDGSFTAATSAPDGYLVVYNTTGVTPTPADGTSYTIGSTIGGSTVVDTDNDTFFSATGLNASTTYYFYVFSYNDACSGGPDYINTNPLTGNETTDVASLYCTPTATNSNYFITAFSTTGGIANISNNSNGYQPNGYGDFTAQFATQEAGSSLDFTGDFVNNSSTNSNFGFGIWVDYNDDGDFDDADEEAYISNFRGDPISDTFTIPVNTAGGSYRMRIVADFNEASPSPCIISANRGEAEDYTLNVVQLPDCVDPVDQAINITFNSITETTMNMQFTAASSSPDGYLVLVNTTGTVPTISDATEYTVGSTFSGNIVLGNDTTTLFNLSGLTEDTTYYFYVFSYNSFCYGGPDYNTTNPLNGSQSTTKSCTLSNANGTSSIGCPTVDAGGFGLNGVDPSPIGCTSSSTATTLEASYLDLGETTSYNVESIAYSPPFQFGCLANPVSVNVDDIWSPVVDLPFDFCFYGNTYDSCVIGSNGVISFDTSLASSFSGWRTPNNIPTNANTTDSYNKFYGPSIHGVHHDVDPEKGGEIGYQLITLDSGCRALVASWFRVPMYDDNTLLYTGMIVFYEETNIIEVYIEEKNTHPGWNSGRASVGLQANATEATVAPGRNTLDANWSTTNEAWRFVPSGNSITELKWYENSVSAANEIIDPNDDGEITVSPSSTTTYIAEVTYNLCNGTPLVVTDDTTVTLTGNKAWNGSQSTAWENPNNWTPNSVPTSSDCVNIPATANDPVMIGTIDGNGLNMTIYNGATLTQQSNSTLTIVEDIDINSGATYRLEDSASLIQINDVPNVVNGTFEMARNTNIRANDYVFWSSPVSVFNIENVSPATPNGYKYRWLPFLNRTPSFPDPLDFGEWKSYNNGVMDIGKGYIIKGPSGHSTTPSQYTATFTGVPNNGTVAQPIERSNYTGGNYFYQPYANGDILTVTKDDDNWNLIGNPYPSAISSIDFLNSPANSNIEGFVYIWTHGTDISNANSDSFYEDYYYNYNVADYIAYNSSGVSTPSGFDGNIGAGQGFFVLMNDSGSTSETITFNNSMRSSAYDNNQFFRNTNSQNNSTRVWLDYISPTGNTNTALVAYVDGATNNKDRMFDAAITKGKGLNLYSMIDESAYIIQGRQWPFIDTDEVPIGINIKAAGIQTIAINSLEGLLNDSNQDIFIEDKELNIVHNLKTSPYTFTSEAGAFNERFILRYNNITLGIDDEDILSNLSIRKLNKAINVTSSLSNISTFELFDITARKIHNNLKVDGQNYSYPTHNLSTGTYIVKVSLENGSIVSKKLII